MIRITSQPFGQTAAGEAVTCWTMQNDAGMTVRALDHGCTVQCIVVPDRDGRLIDVALGYDDIAGYETGSCWFGAFVGRYANRIKNASFTLNGRTYTLAKNDGNNHLHGEYSHMRFDAAAEDGALVFRRDSPAGEEGYPGALRITVAYRLTEDNALIMDYRAVTDADTVVNFTNHTYFNLSGAAGTDILGHRLVLAASRFTEVGAETLPTGRILPVDGTVLDFRREKAIGADIFSDDGQLRLCRGYDHNYILDKAPGLAEVGAAYCPESGVELRFSTTQPGVQLYTGNYVDGDTAPCGKGGVRYPRCGGFCLESQHYPCSPNYPQFPSTVLRPGEEYHETTVYRFGVR